MSLFRRRVLTYFMSMPAIALVNNVLKLGLNEVKLRFRARLSEHLYKKYMQGRCTASSFSVRVGYLSRHDPLLPWLHPQCSYLSKHLAIY